MLLLEVFSEAFDSIYKGKMEQILLVYGLPEEAVTAIMRLCETQKRQFALSMVKPIFYTRLRTKNVNRYN